jgi:hypothetical protein
MDTEQFLEFARKELGLAPSSEKIETIETKIKTKCICGSYILTTSMANHLKSRRHLRNTQSQTFKSSGLNVTFN